MSDNPFEQLGLNKTLINYLRQKDLLDEFLKKHFRMLQCMVHPDRGGNDELSKLVNKAYSAIYQNPQNVDYWIEEIGEGEPNSELLAIIGGLTDKVECLQEIEQRYIESRDHNAELLTTIGSLEKKVQKLGKESLLSRVKRWGNKKSRIKGGYHDRYFKWAATIALAGGISIAACLVLRLTPAGPWIANRLAYLSAEEKTIENYKALGITDVDDIGDLIRVRVSPEVAAKWQQTGYDAACLVRTDKSNRDKCRIDAQDKNARALQNVRAGQPEPSNTKSGKHSSSQKQVCKQPKGVSVAFNPKSIDEYFINRDLVDINHEEESKALNQIVFNDTSKKGSLDDVLNNLVFVGRLYSPYSFSSSRFFYGSRKEEIFSGGAGQGMIVTGEGHMILPTHVLTSRNYVFFDWSDQEVITRRKSVHTIEQVLVVSHRHNLALVKTSYKPKNFKLPIFLTSDHLQSGKSHQFVGWKMEPQLMYSINKGGFRVSKKRKKQTKIHPYDFQSVFKGVYDNIWIDRNGRLRDGKRVAFDTRSREGISGNVVCDEKGRVYGFVSESDNRWMYAVPTDTAKEMIGLYLNSLKKRRK